MANMKNYAEIYLNYFKAGDDLHFHIDNTKTLEDALERHALALNQSAEHLRNIKNCINSFPSELKNLVEIDAGTHHIGISGPEEIIDELLARNLAEPSPFEEDEFEDDEDNEGAENA